MLSTLNYSSQKGEGLYRTPGLLPPKSRALLSKVGNENITSITLFRTPLQKQGIINYLTGNKLKNTLKDLNIDKVFHLGMIINNKYLLDKQEVLHFEPSKIPKNAETLEVPIKDKLNIQTLIDKTKKQMGDEKFSSYDAANNNCSVFISNVLSSNNLNNSQTSIFVNQRAQEIVDKFPSIAKIILKAITNAAAIVNRQLEGEGSKF